MTVVSPRRTDTLRRSPLADRAAELAAGGGRDVRLAEEPFLTQVNLRVHPGSPAVARVEHALDLALPHHEPNLVSGDETAAALWLGPDEWLLVGPDGRAPHLVAALDEALADSLGSTVDVSANRTALRLSGRMSREVLEKLCSIDLHPRAFTPGRCAQTMVGRAQVILWQLSPEPEYRLLVRNSFADYLANVLLDAMAEFAGR
ncbi:sarcosine oxidase subunit gamma family protein [Saccharopolyspora hirsuta]|uniref:Sarcosine oxidase subunit gamma n=1 Tax=Saccharopolyspora hirsuta TaxID=1837 RepID=A0A5M7BNC6_SACHI|nr:sarcosine oxidase subunit gamma family protein [Saccharopolyspora hirsuta]KAA5831309.1 sarcosine oxidase subunit gamma [Saccharopolyspora hirsuta]